MSKKKTAPKSEPASPSKSPSKAKAKPAAPLSAMPRWQPAPEDLAKRFASLIAAMPEAEPRKMFGYPAAFVAGRLFAGLHQDTMIVRLDTVEREKLLEQAGARIFEPMAGRPMREYVVVPPVLVESDEMADWLTRALVYTRSLPEKPARPKKAKKPGK